jgi:hypothetical protein
MKAEAIGEKECVHTLPPHNVAEETSAPCGWIGNWFALVLDSWIV